MNIEKFCDRELKELQVICAELGRNLMPQALRDICLIALPVVNAELDRRKNVKEINKLKEGL